LDQSLAGTEAGEYSRAKKRIDALKQFHSTRGCGAFAPAARRTGSQGEFDGIVFLSIGNRPGFAAEKYTYADQKICEQRRGIGFRLWIDETDPIASDSYEGLGCHWTGPGRSGLRIDDVRSKF
jgi:hypothetical protein